MLRYDGAAINVNCAVDLVCEKDVAGKADAGKNCEIGGNVGGNVSAGKDVTVSGSVRQDVFAGVMVKVKSVSGRIVSGVTSFIGKGKTQQ